jgi:hypothetical protein
MNLLYVGLEVRDNRTSFAGSPIVDILSTFLGGIAGSIKIDPS